MASILAMRINSEQLLILADESTWHLGHIFGYRRTNYGDSLASLFSDEVTESDGVSAIYGGIGFPSYHGEVVRRAKSMLAKEGRDNRAIASKVHKAFLASHDRMTDDRMRFCYGFDRHDLNARSYSKKDKSFEIASGPIVDQARSIAGGTAKGNAYDRINSNGAFLVTRDNVDGVQGWYLNPQGHSVAFATPLVALGDGAGVASHLMAPYLQQMALEERRKGFELNEGIFIALSIASEVRFSVGKMGGYFQILLLDGKRGVREYVSDSCHLVTEIMRAHHWGFITRKGAEELVCSLLLDSCEMDEVEAKLFEKASDKEKLTKYLIGFKPVQLPKGGDCQ